MEIITCDYAEEDNAQVIDLIKTVLAEPELQGGDQIDDDLFNIESEYARFIVAKDGGRVIGCVGLKDRGEMIAELKNLYVSGDYRGQGIGSRLIDQAIKFCQGSGFQKVILDTTKKNYSAIKLFEKVGFTQVEIIGDCLYYEKILG